MRHFALVVGARPNFMKAAPLLRALERIPDIRVSLVHTGQHYSTELSDIFFQELDLPRPDVCLDVGSGSHAAQTAAILERFAEYLARCSPDQRVSRVIVVGDVNSTLACTLAAAKLQIPVAHVEAGLRSFDRSMPEEINRLVTDVLADCLLVSEPAGVENLRREGRSRMQIHLVGNVMIDTLLRQLPVAQQLSTLGELGLSPGSYGVVTIHRPSNVDDPAALRSLVDVLIEQSSRLPLVFPIHPRTRSRLDSFGLAPLIAAASQLRLLPPLGYLPFLCLTSQARLIISDSGGLQEESTALGIPCLTLRENTERPITVTLGTSTLVGRDPLALRQGIDAVLAGRYKQGRCPELWDGRAAERMADVLDRATLQSSNSM